MENSQSSAEERKTLTREIERIVARELEPLRDELARLREHVNALGRMWEPW
jgi:hypothetical protein